MSISVLVLYDAKGPDIESLAGAVARGIGSAKDASPVLKRIEQANTDDLLQADALLLGSPNWSGVTCYNGATGTTGQRASYVLR